MNINDVYEFIDSLDEEEFFEYLTPTSYYNTDLYHSICSKNLPSIQKRKLLEIYFLLSENEDDINQFIFEKMCEFSSDDDDDYLEIEMNGLNWYILIFYLSNCDYYEIYRRLKTSDSLNKEMVKLIELNKNFDRKNNFILNDTEQKESFWTKDLVNCVYLAVDRDKPVDYEKILSDENFKDRNITFKKGDLILFTDFKELKPVGEYFSRIKNEFTSTKRNLTLSKLFLESKVYTFGEFLNDF